jgi:hypothetical protein
MHGVKIRFECSPLISFFPLPSAFISHNSPLTSHKRINLIHIADPHLGLAACARLDPEFGMNLREKQIYNNSHKLAIDEDPPAQARACSSTPAIFLIWSASRYDPAHS